MKKKIDAIVFDFDGVIVDSEPLYEATAEELFMQYGVEIPPEDWKHFKGLSEEMFIRAASEKYQINVPIEEMRKKDLEILKSKFKKHLDYIPGVRDFIKKIDNVYKIGLVTSSSRLLLEWIFGNTPIDNYFKFMVTAEDIEHPKPDPEPFLKMSEILSVLPEKMLVIEDSIHGINSANSAGAVTIGFTSSFSAEELNVADFCAASYDDIWEIVRELI